MDREHKYRAWDEDNEIMYYSDKDYEDCFFGFDKGVVVAWLRETEPQTLDEPAYDYGKPIGVMAYTGLKDKNEREGYGADLVRFFKKLYVIKWDVCNTCFYLESLDEQKSQYTISNLLAGEIIGDIHTTPELMEAK